MRDLGPPSGREFPLRDAFTPEEVSWMTDGTPFLARARVVARMQEVFEDLRHRLAGHLAQGVYLAPEGTDRQLGKIGRGDYLEEMPYLYLDIPRFFEGESSFTYRTLFWWGHGISFSLLLAGPHLPEYRQRLLRNCEILEALSVHVSTAENPWDWQRGPGHTLPLTVGDEMTLARLFRTQSFLKCARFLEFSDPEFLENRIDDAALLTFKAFEPLILA